MGSPADSRPIEPPKRKQGTCSGGEALVTGLAGAALDAHAEGYREGRL